MLRTAIFPLLDNPAVRQMAQGISAAAFVFFYFPSAAFGNAELEAEFAMPVRNVLAGSRQQRGHAYG